MKKFVTIFLLLLIAVMSGCKSNHSNSPIINVIEGYKFVSFIHDGYSLTYIESDGNILAIIKNDDGEIPKPQANYCLTCKISKIEECANKVCPPIMNQDPKANCSAEIKQCMEEECENENCIPLDLGKIFLPQ